MVEFNALLYRRQGQIERLKRILLAGSDAESDITKLEHFKVCFKTSELTYQACQKLSDEILDNIAADAEKSEAVKKQDIAREKDTNSLIDDYYWKIHGLFLKLFGSVGEGNTNQNFSASANSALPKIKLPTFSGNVADWIGYRDLFESTIHNNNSLSGVQKFQYLISTLSDEPLGIVKCLPICSANYPIVYQKLCDRYSSKRILAQTYWQAICSLPPTIADTSKSIYENLNKITENISALNNLGLPTREWSYILYDLTYKRLPKHLRTKFEEQSDKLDLPTFDALHTFLLNYCQSLESVELSCVSRPSSGVVSTPFNNNPKRHYQKQSFVATNQLDSSPSVRCSCCKGDHFISKCDVFLSNVPQKRFELIKQFNLCVNCLKLSHVVKDCLSKYSCSICKRRHHTTLHFNSNTSISMNNQGASKSNIQGSPSGSPPTWEHSSTPVLASTSTQASMSATTLSSVLLSTALIHVQNSKKIFQVVRVLLDSGSQVSFISQKCLNRLGLSYSQFFSSITGINHSSPIVSKGITPCLIKPINCPEPVLRIEAVVLENLMSKVPASPIDVSRWSYLSNLSLADQTFNRPTSIDMILGADVFAQILEPGKIVGQDGGPTAVNTVFGWILMGNISFPSNNVLALSTLVEPFDLRKFWELEEVTSKSLVNPEDQHCESTFQKTHSRNPDGRYVVTLPFKIPEPVEFPGSKSIALRRFLSLEKRFASDPKLRNEYHAVIQNYLDSDHMELAPPSGNKNQSDFFLPHHAVWKPDSLTTRLRVVFDASAVSNNNLSLNDCLYAGPKLQTDICTLLLHFRLHRFVIVADIKQMYRQILVSPVHRRYQKILWRFDQKSPIQTYVLKCVVFGIAPSPYLALRCIKQLSCDEGHKYPLAVKALNEDLYVDDCVSGSDTLEDTKRLQTEVMDLLKLGKFELRKWASNSPELLKGLPVDECQSISFDDSSDSILKVLGLHWLPSSDTFSFSVSLTGSTTTKRTILSDIARIWDPLGFLAPITFFAKYIIQYLWSLGLSWDEAPPIDIVTSWSKFKSELHLLSDIHIPRFLDTKPSQSSVELHGFSDSSEKGYAACIYIRIRFDNGPIQVALLSAKSKVAGLKKMSVARLELCGAVLLSNLFHFILETFKDRIDFDRLFAWCDSTIALSWIRSPAHRWKTFVANRVSHIQDILPSDRWYYVKSSDNPADVASRGMLPNDLVNCSLWWKGPSWLSQLDTSWPSTEGNSSRCSEVEVELAKPVKLTCIGVQEIHFIDSLLVQFSSYTKVQRILVYILRFVTFIKTRRLRSFHSSLSELELRDASRVLARKVQNTVFAHEINLIKTKACLPKPFRKLALFLDDQGLLRVGGRLKNSDLSFDEKHPILLPKRHALTQMVIRHFHHKFLHPGPQTLHSLIRQQFWIIGAKHAINSCISHCFRCFRAKPTLLTPPMGNLPSARVSQLKAFSHSGVDMGGPFLVSPIRRRGVKTAKAYLCLFVCFSTKGVHLELASSLSTEAFLAAFRRFVARRGRVSDMYSDCGSNFVGANRILSTLAQQSCDSLGIQWHFNPPGAPHMGGLWESAIKSVKCHISRVVGNQILTFEEMTTLLAQIESVLNSRPLTAISNNPNDFTALTPNHFLTLEPVSSLPDENLEGISLNRLSRWQLLQNFHQCIWRRWRMEYLHTLQQRHKWHKSTLDVAIGSLVIIKSENSPPGQWALGRIIDLHPGNDGINRVATVKTKQGTFKRPLSKLCLLPA